MLTVTFSEIQQPLQSAVLKKTSVFFIILKNIKLRDFTNFNYYNNT